MAFYYKDAPEISDDAYLTAVESSDKPVVILFWDDTVEVDNIESLAMGLRWLNDGAEARKYYTFLKVTKTAAPNTWNRYKIEDSQICLMSGTDIKERKVGFHYASELNKWLMSKIDKKTPKE